MPVLKPTQPFTRPKGEYHCRVSDNITAQRAISLAHSANIVARHRAPVGETLAIARAGCGARELRELVKIQRGERTL